MIEECLICKAPLLYLETDEEMECAICHRKERSKTRCIRGHYVCNACHTAGMDSILGLCLAALLPSAAICCILIALAAPFLSVRLYRLAELTSLFRVCAPMALLFSLNHLTGSVLSALGLQKQSMYASSRVAVITLFLTWCWAGDPKLRLTGVVMAQYAGQLFSLLAALFIFWRWHISRQAR